MVRGILVRLLKAGQGDQMSPGDGGGEEPD